MTVMACFFIGSEPAVRLERGQPSFICKIDIQTTCGEAHYKDNHNELDIYKLVTKSNTSKYK